MCDTCQASHASTVFEPRPWTDETVSLVLTEAGLPAEQQEVEIDEMAHADVIPVRFHLNAWREPSRLIISLPKTKPTYREMLRAFINRHRAA